MIIDYVNRTKKPEVDSADDSVNAGICAALCNEELDKEDDEWAAEWNERVGITDKRTQVQEIAAWLAKQDNGADSALILAFEREHAELLSLVKDLKACLLSMVPTKFTDVEFCIATLDKTNQIILKHSGA